jgi:hypothetical protein
VLQGPVSPLYLFLGKREPFPFLAHGLTKNAFLCMVLGAHKAGFPKEQDQD